MRNLVGLGETVMKAGLLLYSTYSWLGRNLSSQNAIRGQRAAVFSVYLAQCPGRQAVYGRDELQRCSWKLLTSGYCLSRLDELSKASS